MNLGDVPLGLDAMAAHLLAILRTANERGVKTWPIIFDPYSQTHLHATTSWSALKGQVALSGRPSWVGVVIVAENYRKPRASRTIVGKGRFWGTGGEEVGRSGCRGRDRKYDYVAADGGFSRFRLDGRADPRDPAGNGRDKREAPAGYLRPPLGPLLHATSSWSALKGQVPFSECPTWVRHDDHYPID